MRWKSLILVFIVVFTNLLVNANAVNDLSITQSIQQEKYITALQQLTAAYKNTTALSSDTLSCYLYQTAECLFKLRALKNFETILDLCTNNSAFLNAYYLSKINILKANYLKEKEEIEAAENLLNPILQSNKNKNIVCEAKLSLASLLLARDNIGSAENLYRTVYYTTTDSIQKASALNGIGAYFAYSTNYDSAKIYYSKALTIFQNILGNNHTRTAQVKFNLALIANKFGEYMLAEKLLQETLKSYLAIFGESHPKTAETYGTLGDTYLFEDNLEKALFYLTKERDINLKLFGDTHSSLAYSYLNLGRIYALQGDKLKAEIQFKTGIDLLVKLQQSFGNIYSDLMIEFAKLKSENKDFVASTHLADELLKDKNLEDDYKADIFILLGDNKLAQDEDAKKYFEDANELYKKVFGEKNIYSVDALIGLSKCYLKKNQINDAIAIANKALALTQENQKIIFPYDHWDCLLQLVRCKQKLYLQQPYSLQTIHNDIELIKEAHQEANKIRQTYYSNGSQLYYSEKMAELSQLGIYFLTHFYKTTDTYFVNNLLFFSENNKANLLRSKIINTTFNQMLPIDEQTVSSAIVNKLNYFISLNEHQENTTYNINDSIFYYQNKYEAFMKYLEEKYPKIYHLKYGETPLTISEIQQNLPSDYSLLTYMNDDENYYCLSISKNKIVYKICGNKQKIDQLVQQYQQTILQKKVNATFSFQLYKFLLPQLLSTNLVIAADEWLQQVAFDALTSSPSARNYVLYQHTIQYAFSINTYFHHQQPLENKNVVAFYPDFINSTYPVLNNQKEHQTLKKFSGYNVYYNKNASISNFKKYSKTAGIIHIATHLISDTLSPLKSYLVFQPAKTNAYTLSINDIWKLNTDCQLITLASCQSNFGKQQNGEGIQNFAWAFHYAGARNILSTQWNAADQSTSTIISSFYKNLRNGKNKQEALQLAKINYLKNADAIGAAPYFWANFSLFADATPIQIAPSFLVIYWWLPILFLLFILALLLSYRKVYIKYFRE